MKQHDKLYKSILFILQIAEREEGKSIPYTSLVKYLYLLDCFYAEENNGKQYTNLEWKFLNFGPYSPALEEIFKFESKDSNFSIKKISNNNIEENSSVFRYTGWNKDNILTDLSSSIVSKLTNSIKQYSKLSVTEFLHFIYFKTTPMKNAKHKEILDFSNCKKIDFKETFQPIPEKTLTNSQLKNIKSLLASINLDEDDEDDSFWYDELYYQTIKNAKPIYESEDSININLPSFDGIAKISK